MQTDIQTPGSVLDTLRDEDWDGPGSREESCLPIEQLFVDDAGFPDFYALRRDRVKALLEGEGSGQETIHEATTLTRYCRVPLTGTVRAQSKLSYTTIDCWPSGTSDEEVLDKYLDMVGPYLKDREETRRFLEHHGALAVTKQATRAWDICQFHILFVLIMAATAVFLGGSEPILYAPLYALLVVVLLAVAAIGMRFTPLYKWGVAAWRIWYARAFTKRLWAASDQPLVVRYAPLPTGTLPDAVTKIINDIKQMVGPLGDKSPVGLSLIAEVDWHATYYQIAGHQYACGEELYLLDREAHAMLVLRAGGVDYHVKTFQLNAGARQRACAIKEAGDAVLATRS